MAGKDENAGKAGLFVGAAAVLATAIALARSVPVKAQEAISGVVSLTQETMNLLISMAEGIGAIIGKMDDVIAAIKSITPWGGGGGGSVTVNYPPNTSSTFAQFVGCPVGQPKAWQLPSIVIPDGMELQIKGAPTNWGIVYVARSEVQAGQPTQSWPLLPNEAVGYKVKNANALWIGAVLAPPTVPQQEGVYITVEQA